MRYIISLLLIGFVHLLMAQNVTVSGYITDANSQEALVGATLSDTSYHYGISTDAYGFYSLTIPKGIQGLRASALGYQNTILKVNLTRDTIINIALQNFELEEIVVESSREESSRPVQEQTQMSKVTLTPEQIEAIPSIGGERDVLKAFILTPGVSTGTEGSAGLLVRGGSYDQNLILLDGMPVYNVSHLFGFLSVFNTDAIKNADLIKGGFPARYGGRLSSVMDISLREGNMKKVSGSFGIGLISSRFLLEGPLFSERTSFLLSARSAYIGLLTLPNRIAFYSGRSEQYINYSLYDINAKINHRFSDKTRLFLSLYTGTDYLKNNSGSRDPKGGFSSINTNKILWGNITTSARLNQVISPKLFAKFIIGYTRYRFRYEGYTENEVETTSGTTERQNQSFLTRSVVRDYTAKAVFDYYANARHVLRTGVDYTNHYYTPDYRSLESNVTNDTVFAYTKTYANEASLWAEDDWRLSPAVSLNVGTRFTLFNVGQKTYTSPEPRVSLRWQPAKSFSLKGSCSYMRQYLHLLANNGVGLPNDVWVPVTNNVGPQSAWQFALGSAGTLPLAETEWSVEAYYKKLSHLIDFKDGVNFLTDLDKNWEQLVETGGTGQAYGLELFLQKKVGRFSGMFGYTWAWNTRQFANINHGKTYPSKFDRRHDIDLTLSYKLNDHWSFAATWVFNTGQPVTLPVARYTSALPGESDALVYNGRNQQRMPSYHRLDIGIKHTKFTKRGGERTISFDVFNAYNRRNPYYLALQTQVLHDSHGNNTGLRQVVLQKSLFPILPSISIAWKY